MGARLASPHFFSSSGLSGCDPATARVSSFGFAGSNHEQDHIMDMQPPPADVQMAQAEIQPEAPVEPVPVKVDVTKYVPESATSVTMIVTVSPPSGTAVVYAPGYENYATIFKGPRTMGEVRLAGPLVYVKLYGATSFDIQYTNYRQP
jgi:hypothetical protein